MEIHKLPTLLKDAIISQQRFTGADIAAQRDNPLRTTISSEICGDPLQSGEVHHTNILFMNKPLDSDLYGFITIPFQILASAVFSGIINDFHPFSKQFPHPYFVHAGKKFSP